MIVARGVQGFDPTLSVPVEMELGSLERIGRYEVVERLGSGGFATVYLVRDPVLDSEVAAKVLAENWSDKVDLRDRFIREAQLLRRIDSDRVVTVHDIGELPSGQPYFVMALVDRGTLDERLVIMSRPAAADIRNVGVQLAECLRTIHSNDLIHRDIKPSNLLIAGPRASGEHTETGLLGPAERLVLGDFGLAKDIALQSTVGFTISAGTGGYAAPEQMSPVGVPDRQTDLYAATGVMYRVITGETPPGFDLATETVPFPDDQPGMAGDLGRFFRQGMAFYPERRHPSVEAWLHDLESVIAGIAGGLPSIPGSSESGPTSWANSGETPALGNTRPETWAPPSRPQQGQQPPPHQSGIPSAQNPTVSSGPNPLTDPRSMPTPVISSGPNPAVAPPSGPNPAVGGYQAPNQQSFPPSQQYAPPQQFPASQQYPQTGTQHSPISYEQVRGKRGGVGKWVALVAVLALAVGGGLAFFLWPSGPVIEGPDRIAAGETGVFTATYQESERFVWTDWNGDQVEIDAFPVDAIAPGSLTFSVEAIAGDGDRSPVTNHTITIVPSPDGPVIEGPTTVTVGELQLYTFNDPTGSATNPRWVDDVKGTQPGDIYELRPLGPGIFRFTLIVTLDDGTDIGAVKEVTIVE